MHVMTADAGLIASFEVVGAEVLVGDVVFEHVPDGNQQCMLDRDDSLLCPATCAQPVIQGVLVAAFSARRGPRYLLQCRA